MRVSSVSDFVLRGAKYRLRPAFRTIQFRIYRGWRSGWSNGGALFMLKSDLLPVLRAGTGVSAARKHQGEKKAEGTACNLHLPSGEGSSRWIRQLQGEMVRRDPQALAKIEAVRLVAMRAGI